MPQSGTSPPSSQEHPPNPIFPISTLIMLSTRSQTSIKIYMGPRFLNVTSSQLWISLGQLPPSMVVGVHHPRLEIFSGNVLQKLKTRLSRERLIVLVECIIFHSMGSQLFLTSSRGTYSMQIPFANKYQNQSTRHSPTGLHSYSRGLGGT